MKKFLVFIIMFLPISAFSAPSVKMLGKTGPGKLVSDSGAKITPSKATTSTGVAARIGTLRAKGTASGAVTGAITGASSRFPSFSSVKSYNSVANPVANIPVAGTAVPASADTDEIVQTVQDVQDNLQNNYYDKNKVYDNDNFRTAVKDVDDPVKDAIHVGAPTHHVDDLPDGYAYIWIEEE